MAKFSGELAELLEGCEQVSITAFEDAQTSDSMDKGYYVTNPEGELTHLLITNHKEINLDGICNLKQLQILLLENCNIQRLPANISQLQNLKELNLPKNRIDLLPENINQLQNLTQLNLHDNLISTLPDSIGQLKNLRDLSLGMNKLCKLPRSMGELSNLKRLYLFENQFREFPSYICQLRNLRELHLGSNHLIALPRSIVQLQNLTSLRLPDNQLQSLPQNIEHLKNLRFLSLNKNQLHSLPYKMERLEKLKVLILNKNPLPISPEELKDLSPQDQIRTILKIQQGKTSPLNEAKILVVGDERVGKTSLIRRLAGLTHDANELTTQGINISQQLLKNDIKVNIWDFAGQEITHQTHQFFLTRRCLYLYILDAQKEDNDADIFHWLSVITSYGGEHSPIMVVVNQCDKNLGYRFDHRRYQGFNIVDVLYTSACNETDIEPSIYNKIDHNIDDLQQIIEQHIAKLDGIDFPFPESWFKLKQNLEVFKENETDLIESAKYEELCEQQGIHDHQDQQTLLRLLNQIGTIITYQDDSRLDNMQIINPQWVTYAVYKTVRAKAIKDDGILTTEHLAEILKGEAKYKTRHYRWIMDLLNQFELSFKIDDTKVLIPAKLSTIQPAFDLSDYQQGLNLRFNYINILKKSVIWQLTVKRHRYIDQHGVKYWRRGAFFALGDSKAVVVANENTKTIDIAINNNSRSARDLLSHIREQIKIINGDNLEAIEEVPLIIDNQIVGYEDYEFITDAERNREDRLTLRIKDPKTGRTKSHGFDISQLLDGYRKNKAPAFDYQQLTIDLVSISAMETENRQLISRESEDQTNDRFSKALQNRQYIVADQSRGGESASGIQAGERDIVIRNQQGAAESIIEAFVLDSCKKDYIKAHYRKLTEHYDATGNPRNFILIYAQAVNFDNLWQKYSTLCDSEYGGFDTSQTFSDKANVKTGITIFKRREVVHIMVNFYSQASQQ
ncbi:MAG: internalin A [Phenylobacterium sp.]|jgi:internalin A